MHGKNKKEILILFLILTLLCLPMQAGAAAEEADTVSVKIPVEQEFWTKNQVPENLKRSFRYECRALEDGTPMPEENVDGRYTFALEGNEMRYIESIYYTHAGVYHYEIRKIPENELQETTGQTQGKYHYDTTVYRVTVAVENGIGNYLYPQVIIENGRGEKVDAARFVCGYTGVKPAPQEPFEPIRTGDDASAGIWAALAVLSALLVVALLLRRNRKRKEVFRGIRPE